MNVFYRTSLSIVQLAIAEISSQTKPIHRKKANIPMSPLQLRAVRQILFFSVDEAAKYIAANKDRPDGISSSEWLRWERGYEPIPEEIDEKLLQLLDFRVESLEETMDLLEEQEEDSGDEPNLIAICYENIEDFVSLPGYAAIYWRPQCSVVAELMATCGADGVVFDAKKYHQWRGSRTDSEELRAEWAEAAYYEGNASKI